MMLHDGLVDVEVIRRAVDAQAQLPGLPGLPKRHKRHTRPGLAR